MLKIFKRFGKFYVYIVECADDTHESLQIKNILTFCQKKYIVFLTRKGVINDAKH